jgi:hypothetical protein
MAWIESHQTLLNHPKLLMVCQTLGVDRPTMIGHLHILWWWCIDYAIDGELHFTNAQISQGAGWTQDADLFVNALVEARFIDRDQSGLRIHDWLDFCGMLVEKRLERIGQRKHGAQKAAEQRTMAAKRKHTDAKGTTIAAGSHRQAPNQPNRTKPNQTVPNRTRPHISKQKLQQQQQKRGRGELAGDPVKNRSLNGEEAQRVNQPDRHQQAPTTTSLLEEGAAADNAGPGILLGHPIAQSVGAAQERRRPPPRIPDDPEADIEKTIREKIGRRRRLSRSEMSTVISLRNKYGSQFDSACDSLHSGVCNPAAYLLSILEPESTNKELARRLRSLIARGGSDPNPDHPYDRR